MCSNIFSFIFGVYFIWSVFNHERYIPENTPHLHLLPRSGAGSFSHNRTNKCIWKLYMYYAQKRYRKNKKKKEQKKPSLRSDALRSYELSPSPSPTIYLAARGSVPFPSSCIYILTPFFLKYNSNTHTHTHFIFNSLMRCVPKNLRYSLKCRARTLSQV